MRQLPIHGMAAVLCAVCAAGCSDRPSPPRKPSFNASDAGKAAVAMYDKDGSGTLDAQELTASPALHVALPRIDTDGDGVLSADEIAARIARWFATGTTMMDASPVVSLDGRPLAGAEVVFEPEAFLGEGFKPCRGTTDESGRAMMAGADANHPGAYVGAYRIRISKMDGGREILPARYNAESELGLEVAEDVDDLHLLLDLRLRSR